MKGVGKVSDLYETIAKWTWSSKTGNITENSCHNHPHTEEFQEITWTDLVEAPGSHSLLFLHLGSFLASIHMFNMYTETWNATTWKNKLAIFTFFYLYHSLCKDKTVIATNIFIITFKISRPLNCKRNNIYFLEWILCKI